MATYMMLRTPESVPLVKKLDLNVIKRLVVSYRASFTLKPAPNGGYLATVTDKQLSFALPEEGETNAQSQQQQ